MGESKATIADISIKDENARKGIDFLNKHVQIYQDYTLERKNENASRTIDFITTQLDNVSDSLDISEDLKQSFKTKYNIVDISSQSQQFLEQLNTMDIELVEMETQHKYYTFLKDYIVRNKELETVIAPATMGISDPLLNSLVLELNGFIIEKSSFTSIKNSEHPKLKRLNAQIEKTKVNLLENIENIIANSEFAINDLKSRIADYEIMVKSIPQTERNYLNIERKYKLNNAIYTFLLQKLSEAQIAKASNVLDTQILEKAHVTGTVGPDGLKYTEMPFYWHLSFQLSSFSSSTF